MLLGLLGSADHGAACYQSFCTLTATSLHGCVFGLWWGLALASFVWDPFSSSVSLFSRVNYWLLSPPLFTPWMVGISIAQDVFSEFVNGERSQGQPLWPMASPLLSHFWFNIFCVQWSASSEWLVAQFLLSLIFAMLFLPKITAIWLVGSSCVRSIWRLFPL